MTDNEIIKALECCMHDDYNYCKECPYRTNKPCQENLIQDAFYLINRQQAEIIETRRDLLNEIYALEHQLETTKAEAIKEFAERLKEYTYDGGPHPTVWDEFAYAVDNLVAEMVGDSNAE